MEFVYSAHQMADVTQIKLDELSGKTSFQIKQFFMKQGKDRKEDCQIDLDSLECNQCTKEELAGLIVEGFMQGGYSFSKEGLKKLNSETLFQQRTQCITYPEVKVFIVSKSLDTLDTKLQEAKILGESIGYARLLGDLPNNYLHIQDFVTYATNLAKELSLDLNIYRNQELEKMNCGGILAVNKASEEEAAMLSITYHGGNEEPYTALVGKGILFDSGGYHVKSIGGMEGMKYDMCGAANVLELMEYAARTKMKKNIIAVIPLAENLIASNGVKMGDVITTMSGKTVEIYNIDAEGRLILCDALTYACQKATTILDFATLTYSCQGSLGDKITGVFSNTDSLFQELWEASSKTGEKIWRLPLDEIFHKDIKWSKTAELANYAPNKSAGASVAACFLEEFIEEGITWAHFDMVGTSVVRGDSEESQAGATGANMSTAVAYLAKDLRA